MLVILFVFSLLSSCLWLGYVLLYTYDRLGGNDFTALPVEQMAAYVGVGVLPVWAIWQIFSLISQYIYSRKTNDKMIKLLEQTKKNQDYTDLIVRVMLDAEHEIKDGFVLNKFDTFIADLNEILADILLRSNVVSTLQLEQLWIRVRNGERWVLAKSLVESQKRQTNFTEYFSEKMHKDPVFKGTLFEFCARYQDLCALLEKHDRDRVFISMIETGVLGKAYSLLAPVSDAFSREDTKDIPAVEAEKDDFSQNILNMPEPQTENTESFWDRFHFLGKDKTASKEDPTLQDDNEFFDALQKNLSTAETEPIREKEPQDDVTVNAYQMAEPDYMPAPEIAVKNSEQKKTPESQEKNDLAYPFGGWINDKD